MSRNIVLLICLPLIVAACGTPQEQCIRRNTDEYRTVQNLLAEVEGNLQRGYAWKERQVKRTRYETCTRKIKNSEGEETVITEPCWRDVVETVEYRDPIDPIAEQRKAEGLRIKAAQLRSHADQVVIACRAAYPEEN